MISDLIILDRPQVITGTPTPLNFDVDENGLLAVARAPVANITNTTANTHSAAGMIGVFLSNATCALKRIAFAKLAHLQLPLHQCNDK
jgi:hypothetical protein